MHHKSHVWKWFKNEWNSNYWSLNYDHKYDICPSQVECIVILIHWKSDQILSKHIFVVRKQTFGLIPLTAIFLFPTQLASWIKWSAIGCSNRGDYLWQGPLSQLMTFHGDQPISMTTSGYLVRWVGYLAEQQWPHLITWWDGLVIWLNSSDHIWSPGEMGWLLGKMG